MSGNGNGNGYAGPHAGPGLSDQLPPQNLEAERRLLSGIMIDNTDFSAVCSEVSADDFYRSAHEVMFRAMTVIAERDDPINPVSVAEELTCRDQFKQIGGDDFLLEISSAAPHAKDNLYYARLIRQKAIDRQSAQIAAEHTRAVYSQMFTPTQSLETTINRLSRLIEGQEEAVDYQIRDFPDPPGKAAFHGVLGQIVQEIDPYTEANLAAILIQLLTGFGNMVGAGPHWVHESNRHRLNLYICLVGNTADGRKGTSWGYPRRILSQVDPTWADRIIPGINSGPALIEQVADEETTRTGSFLRGVPDKRLFMYESEFTRLLAIFSRDSETLGMVLRQAWEDDHLAAISKKNPVRATGAHISVNAHVTHDDLHANLRLTDIANGLGNRFIWFCTKASKTLEHEEQMNWAKLQPMIQQLQESLAYVNRIIATDVVPMGRSPTAQEYWREQLAILRKPRPGLLGAMLARGPAQVMRLASIYAGVDKQSQIEIDHLEAAMEIWAFSVRSIDFIFGDRLGDPDAEKVLLALQQAGTDGLSQTKIQRQVFGNHKDATSLSILLQRMVRSGLVRREEKETEGAGRPVRMWYTDTPPTANSANLRINSSKSGDKPF